MVSMLGFFALVAVTAAHRSDADISANSRLGQRLLSEATVIQPARFLQENQRDISFVAGYSIRYTGCSSVLQVGVTNGSYNNNGNAEMIYVTHLAKFSLCPTADCVADCVGGGEYVMSLETFVDAYTEAKLTAQEYACEMVRENCYCDEANDDQVCESACYTAAGLTGCEEVEGEGDAFEVQRYLECRELDFNKYSGAVQAADADGNYAVYYVGPYCSTKNSFDIHLGVFSNQYCTAQVESSIYMNEMAYDFELPYSNFSLVDQTCIDCAKVDENQNNNNNNNNAAEVSETCEAMYNYAAKCEQKMDISSEQDNSGCEYINVVLPYINSANKTAISTPDTSGCDYNKPNTSSLAIESMSQTAATNPSLKTVPRGRLRLCLAWPSHLELQRLSCWELTRT